MSSSSKIWQQIGKSISEIQTIVSTAIGTILGGSATAYTNWLPVTNIHVGVTPATSSTKVMLICVMANYCGAVPLYRIKRNGVVIFTPTTPSTRQVGSFASGHGIGTPLETSVIYIDSPASTNLQQYTIEMVPNSTGTTTYYYNRDSGGGTGSLSTLMAVQI